MKRKQYHLHKLKKELELRKAKGRKYVTWSLSAEEREYLFQLGYDISVELYVIETKRFINPKSINGVLKDIHFAHKKGRDTIVRNLKKDQLKTLDKYDIKYYPIKYRVFL